MVEQNSGKSARKTSVCLYHHHGPSPCIPVQTKFNKWVLLCLLMVLSWFPAHYFYYPKLCVVMMIELRLYSPFHDYLQTFFSETFFFCIFSLYKYVKLGKRKKQVSLLLCVNIRLYLYIKEFTLICIFYRFIRIEDVRGFMKANFSFQGSLHLRERGRFSFLFPFLKWSYIHKYLNIFLFILWKH